MMSLNYIPPIKSRNTKALINGTVRLSSPFGVSASSTVAKAATPKEANSRVDREKGHRYEKSSKLSVTLTSVIENIATVPSMLFFENMLNW